MSNDAKVKVALNKLEDPISIDEMDLSSLDAQFFQYSTELAADEVFWMWPDSSIFYVNKSACNKLGYKREELLGMKVWEWDPLFTKEVWPDFWSHLRSKKHMIFETKHMTKNGHVFPVEIQGHYVVLGEKEFLIAYVTDISDRVLRENEIKAYQSNLENILEERTKDILDQKKLFEELVNLVPVMVNSFDADGRCLLWNKSCEKVLGYSYEEAKSESNLMNNFYPDPELCQQVIQDITNPDGQFREYPVVVKDGTTRTQLWSNFKLMNDMMIGCGVDITELKETEARLDLEKQRLNKALKKLQLVTEGSQDGFWHWTDPKNDNVEWSDNLYTMLGYLPREFEPSFAVFQTMLHPDDIELTRQVVENSIKSRETFDVQYRIKNKDGSYRWYRGRGTPYYNDKGEFLEMAGSISDIHERKLLESDLKVQKEKAEQASLAKSQFLANMSHEIRTPMNGVLGMTNQLLKTELNDKQLSQLQTVKSSASSLLNIINDILDLSKIEAGKMVVENIPFDLLSLINETSSTTLTMAQEKNLAFVVNFDRSEALSGGYQGDPTRIRQVIFNLIGNAIKFTEKGSITFNIKVLESTEGTDLIRFEIVDSGVGIKIRAQEKLFKPFSQQDESTTRKFGGTGLGLSICKQLIELMGGEISFSSELGKGSKFWFDLPLKKATVSNANMDQDLPENWESFTYPGARVLLVEDNEVNREVAIMNLEDAELTVDSAENGSIAFNLIKENQYDIVFMDCQMPVMDGYTATKQIRTLAKARELPIVALTANAMEGEQKKCLDAGMTDYLSKPFEYQDIIEKLEKFIPKFNKNS